MPPVLVREFGAWKVLKPSETDSRLYYYNAQTKEVTWLIPPGLPEECLQTSSAPPTRARRNSPSSSVQGPNLFGVALEIDNVMVNSACEVEDEAELSRSENDRPLQAPPPPVTPEPEVWKPVVGQPCEALWTDGNYWKAVVLEDLGGLRFKVTYDIDGTEALVVREAVRPSKAKRTPKLAESKAPPAPTAMTSSKPSSSPRPASHQAKIAVLVEQFTVEFPLLRLPSLDDFYRPQYAAALQRFGHRNFELLCESNSQKGGFFRSSKLLS